MKVVYESPESINIFIASNSNLLIMKNLKALIAFAILFYTFSLVALAGGDKVYVTEGGKKYHKKNCSIVKTGKSETTLVEAKKKGYLPCNVCYKESKK